MEQGAAVRRKSWKEEKKEAEKAAAASPTEAKEGPKERKRSERRKEKEGKEEKKGEEEEKKEEKKKGEKEKKGEEKEKGEKEKKGEEKEKGEKGAATPTEAKEGPKERKRSERRKEEGKEKKGEKEKKEEEKKKGEKEEEEEKGEKGAATPTEAKEEPKGRKRSERRKEEEEGKEKKGEKEKKKKEKKKGEKEKEEKGAATSTEAKEGPKGRKRSERQKEEGGEGEEEGAETKRAAQAARGKSLARGASSGAPPALRRVLEGLRLASEERSAASQRVNPLRDRLLAAVKKEPCFRDVEVFGAGSYYERVKICHPNEFDIMLKIPKVRLELEPCEVVTSSGAFYYVKLKRDPAKKELKQFCDDNERLSSSRMLARLRNIIIDEVKKMTDMNVTVEKKRPGSPAVTLLIKSPPAVISVDIILSLEFHHPKWCSSTEDGLGIEEWMGTKAKQSLCSEPLFLVAKNIKDGKCFTDNTWRLSFSNIEKMLLQNHGQTKTCCEKMGKKCCRKDCLKLLKYLLEQLRTKHENRNHFDKFCSYQVKTAFFHACVKWPKDSDWLLASLDECFNRLLNYFLNCLKEAKLPHFFIPEFNLFSEERIERTKRNALVKAIEKEINNRFPIFFN